MAASAPSATRWIDVASETPNNTSFITSFGASPRACSRWYICEPQWTADGQYPASTVSPLYVVFFISSPALDCQSHLGKHQRYVDSAMSTHAAPPPSARRDGSRPPVSGQLGIWHPGILLLAASRSGSRRQGTSVLLCTHTLPSFLLHSGAAPSTLAPFFIYPNKGKHNQAFACWRELTSLTSPGDPGRAKELGPGRSMAVPGFQNVPRAAAAG